MKSTKFFIFILIILLILLAGFFVYNFFIKPNNYLIENKYYGFGLQTPKGWNAEEKTLYSENYITQILAECKNDKSNNASAYKIGVFRFESQKYPETLGDPGYFPSGFPAGVILEITVNCISGSAQREIGNSNFRVAGEKVFEEIIDLPGFGKTEYISFYHNNFQYIVKEYVYVSPSDKSKNEETLRKNYAEVFSKIISSFKFTK